MVMDIHILEKNRRMLKVLLSVLVSLAVLLSFDSKALAADSYAIFSLNSEFSELSITKARKLYRGKTKRLQGHRVELADWPDTSSERSEFYRYLLNKNIAQMNAHWASLSFSGKARPPKVIDNSNIDTLLEWMKEKPNRIGYAPVSSLPSNAQILYVVSSEK
ncbi:hypothetical protein ABXV22_03970 [Vibrio rotiferianus]|uniref:Phosphate ABC transporter substrate-binding protein n=2 Tax=Vibrio rotiferianus TaxID=190895 RepID=A0A7Y3Z5W1_9VIBR|nr:hypothetical protein [Vibrio rotiferianus]NOH46928.1 hypothetical protein [Vibrio rotiferianus]NOH65601.1 hypothetical protein [Vibrio rotiferianus]